MLFVKKKILFVIFQKLKNFQHNLSFSNSLYFLFQLIFSELFFLRGIVILLVLPAFYENKLKSINNLLNKLSINQKQNYYGRLS